MSKIFSPWTVVIALCAAAFLLMLGPAKNDSAIVDELAHIPAGYSYDKFLDYRLNPEHPPLVKMIAAFPLVFENLNFPTNQPSWTTDVNGQWDAGAQFLYGSGNNADRILFLARIGPMLLTLLLIVFVYVFSKEVIGRWWGLLPAFLVALSPNFLAHGHYVTTDVGAALGILLATFCFLKYLFHDNKKYFWVAGLTFGLAQLMKFSAVLLPPYFLLIALIFYLLKYRKFNADFFKKFLKVFLIFLVGGAVIYLLYLLTTWNYPIAKQLTDTEAILQSFGFRPAANLVIWMAGNRFFRPLAQYILGVLMVLQRSVGGNTGYFLGEISASGHWYYFPTVFVMKEPLATLILIVLAGCLSLFNILKSFKNGLWGAFKKFYEYLNVNFIEFSLVVFIFLYWGQSMRSTLNIGFRHLFPTLPFIYILTAGGIKKWLSLKDQPLARSFLQRLLHSFGQIINSAAKFGFLFVLLIWLALGAFFHYPYFLSYFNEIFGGTQNGYQYVTDSNYDWGQDLKRLKLWTAGHLQPDEKIAVDYFGGGNPKYYLGDQEENWSSAQGNPKDSGINWLAVSVNTIQGAIGKTVPGFSRNPLDEYRWLDNPLMPYDRAGTSIFIYKLN